MRVLTIFSLLLFASVAFGQGVASKLELPALFCDNMVLQQKAKVKIWGKAQPAQLIQVKTSWGFENKATVNNDGSWQMDVSTIAAGGPYSLTIISPDKTITLQNVLLGEVWFCSGQSNMEMPLAGWPPNDTIAGATYEIAHATNSQIRLFNVKKAMAVKPAYDCEGTWQVCNTETIKPFSATAYFFAKKLYENLNVPIGLIESAWGGTPAESWISAKSLTEAGEYVSVLKEIENSMPQYNEHLAWIKNHKYIEINTEAGNAFWKTLDFGDGACAAKDYADGSWPVMKLPVFWEQTVMGDFDGVVWLRRSVNIPAEMKGKDLLLSLGPIDDMDCAYFNGVKIGSTEEPGYYQIARNYTIPGTLVNEGLNSLAIRVVDNAGGGGLYGKESQMFIQSKSDATSPKISIAGDWKFMPVAEMIDTKFYMFDIAKNEFFAHARPKSINAYTASVLFNAMVNPLVPYTIKGAIWYQGEANVGRAEQYRIIFPLMISDWRKAWGLGDFPFYFVQIAPWEYGNDANATVSAELRDAQRLSLAVPNTGMAVTLDIGNVKNIHPSNKKDVGDRLARWALAKDYAKNVIYSGPLYKSMKREGKAIRISFTNTEGGLTAKNGTLNEFEIAGANGVFEKATAKIVGNDVVVSSDKVTEPSAVRYCWRNGSEASLFNGAGLPASGFKTE